MDAEPVVPPSATHHRPRRLGGRLSFDATSRRLADEQGAVLHLTPKAFDLLEILVGEAPRVLRKAELHSRLWPGTFVTDAALTSLVKELRRVLCDDDEAARLIRTAHAVGYAFAGTVEWLSVPEDAGHWLVGPRHRYVLRAGTNIIGRDPASDVWLDDQNVSRRHARIVIASDRVAVEDLGSKNGTSVGIQKLMVPAHDADLPQPRLADGSPDPFFQTTEAKRYLGKQLFHDPVRTVRILPEFGGVPATARTACCASCHIGEAASKAGTLLNFAAGGEGRGYTDARGNFIPRRRPRTDILPLLRQSPLFPGDALVDSIPTLTDVYRPRRHGRRQSSPGRKLPALGLSPVLLPTGRLDALDSVARNAPSAIGAAFNNRLLLGGFAGEPDASPGGLNPFGHPRRKTWRSCCSTRTGCWSSVRRATAVRDLSEAVSRRVSGGGRPGRRGR